MVTGALELQDVPVGQVAPQSREGRWFRSLAAEQEQVAATGQVADGHLGPHRVIAVQQQPQQVGEQRVPLLAHRPEIRSCEPVRSSL
jgi:hypothetical protein